MARSRRQIASALLQRYGQTFAEELGFDLTRNTPSPLFRLLCFALLASARISHNIALEAARALARQKWTTARAMAEATWRERADTLNRAGYARYDESTSRMLGDTAQLLLDHYRGDLRNLREEVNRDPAAERRLLKQFKGIGDVGVDIYFREVQIAWEEVYPCADGRVLKAASKLGLGKSASDLARLVRGRRDFTRLTAALVRIQLAKDYKTLEKSL
jgi:hypothetical protein